MSIQQEVMEVVREMPGITSPDIVELMPHVNKNTVASALTYAYKKGELEREKVEYKGTRTYAYRMNPSPNLKPPAPKRRLTKPTENGLMAKLEELETQVSDLELWKREAIERFPDLAVPPVIFRARKILEKIFRNDNVKLLDLKAGKLDDTPIMQATVMGLEETA